MVVIGSEDVVNRVKIADLVIAFLEISDTDSLLIPAVSCLEEELTLDVIQGFLLDMLHL